MFVQDSFKNCARIAQGSENVLCKLGYSPTNFNSVIIYLNVVSKRYETLEWQFTVITGCEAPKIIIIYNILRLRVF